MIGYFRGYFGVFIHLQKDTNTFFTVFLYTCGCRVGRYGWTGLILRCNWVEQTELLSVEKKQMFSFVNSLKLNFLPK